MNLPVPVVVSPEVCGVLLGYQIRAKLLIAQCDEACAVFAIEKTFSKINKEEIKRGEEHG